MNLASRLPAFLGGLIGLVLLALAVVYLSVECQALPGFMGPIHGDSSPRTGLGLVTLVASLAVLVGTMVAFRHKSS